MRIETFDSLAWHESIIPLLDDHHLVVLSDSPASRSRFTSALSRQLQDLADTEVVTIDGSAAVDLPSICRQIEKRLGIAGGANHWWRDLQSVIAALRRASTAPKRRYFIWHEAHTMLEADLELFCRLVNILLAVAAEREHIDLNPLVLQRVVFVGDAKLGAYAEDESGQFCRWLEHDEVEAPFWEVASVIDRPPVLTCRIDE